MSRLHFIKRVVLLATALLFPAAHATLNTSVPPRYVPVIESISVSGTNLHLVAAFPGGLARAVLEMRPTLDDNWESASSLGVPIQGGTVEFTIPMPSVPSAFFRLNANLLQAAGPQTPAQYSAELQFVTVPPLGPDSANSSAAVLHFKGMIDGSDRIVIRREGALWEHVNWGWPAGAVTVGGHRWNPSEKNFIAATGGVLFLQEKYSLRSPRLEPIEGRDLVALERAGDAVVVYLNDTLQGAAPYEFKVHFPLAHTERQPKRSSVRASLKITAVIDGSDLLKITASDAKWTPRAWSAPQVVTLNDVTWDLGQTNVLLNTGNDRFLPASVDLSSAQIVSRKGRDLATMWADKDALWVNFADNPNGADSYELEISFGN